ncbi:MAG TPA: hypothetical protein VND93_10370 [Myxococcales bacterium]|nr:hypothetical protein [Myxococcales bacterium]
MTRASILDGTEGTAQIPVDIVAFHAEGMTDEVAYSIRMFSDVKGRLDVALTSKEKAGALQLWGRMVVTIKPLNPAAFGGMDKLTLVSQRWVRQRARVTEWPPASGNYLESVEPESYVALGGEPKQVLAVVKKGRVIFTSLLDPFLQARTRVNSFFYVDSKGKDLPAGAEPGRIAGVRLVWADVRTAENRVTHYRLYRYVPGKPETLSLFPDRISGTQFIDREHNGTVTHAYAVVPAKNDAVGEEVMGIGLDYVEVVQVQPADDTTRPDELRFGHLGFKR